MWYLCQFQALMEEFEKWNQTLEQITMCSNIFIIVVIYHHYYYKDWRRGWVVDDSEVGTEVISPGLKCVSIVRRQSWQGEEEGKFMNFKGNNNFLARKFSSGQYTWRKENFLYFWSGKLWKTVENCAKPLKLIEKSQEKGEKKFEEAEELKCFVFWRLKITGKLSRIVSISQSRKRHTSRKWTEKLWIFLMVLL